MLPDFVIIGAKKCGTTSLYHYLSLHPDIAMSFRKELRFFSANWHRGQAWYERQFPTTGRIRGEATPDYARFPYIPDVPSRMASLVPQAKLIYMVRDPIERSISHHMERLSIFLERRPLDVLLKEPRMRLEYLCESRYFTQLMQYRAVFPESQILIVGLEDLQADRRATLRRVFAFLGVDREYWSPEFESVLNSSEEKRQLGRLGAVLYPRWLREILRHEAVPYRVRRAYTGFVRLFSVEAEKPRLEQSLIESLASDLADDVAKFSAATGFDTSRWKHHELYVRASQRP